MLTGILAADYFVSKGLKTVGVIKLRANNTSSVRAEFFSRHCREQGIKVFEFTINGPLVDLCELEKLVADFSQLTEKPEGLFCFNDYMTVSIYIFPEKRYHP